ncbi:MAG: TAXI family TRAP transporter solute-binding subunit [Rhodospirillales bacterium]|nr:TAXI family TRAP transporter solute-binding subunit [Rhodospirillales bacterium]
MSIISGRHRAQFLSALAVAFAATVAVSPSMAQTVVYGTDKVGSIVNATGGTIGKIISQRSALTVRVRSFAGPEAWIPELDSGKVQFGSHFAASFFVAFNNVGSRLHTKNLRLVRSSKGASLLGFMVRKDSPIKSIKDLKGKRVTSGYGGQPVIRVMTEASLAAHGLTYNDVTKVPTVAVVGGVQAIVEGRADAAWASPMMPQARQANAKVGIRFVPMNDLTDAQMDTIRKVSKMPFLYADKFKGNMPYFPKGTQLLTQEMYVIASSHTSDKAVRAAAEALWNNEAELRKSHRALAGFLNKSSVSLLAELPYHPAAIAFYKEKGLWSAKADAMQARLMKKAM